MPSAKSVLWTLAVLHAMFPAGCYRSEMQQASKLVADYTGYSPAQTIRDRIDHTVSLAIDDLALPEAIRSKILPPEVEQIPNGNYYGDEARLEAMKVCTSDDASAYSFSVKVQWAGKQDTQLCLDLGLRAPNTNSVECAKFWRAGCPSTSEAHGTQLFLNCNSAVNWLGSEDLEDPCGLGATQIAKIVDAVANMKDEIHSHHNFLFPVWTLSDQAHAICYYDMSTGPIDDQKGVAGHEVGDISDVTALKYGKFFYEQYFGYVYADRQDPLHKKPEAVEASAAAWEKLGRLTLSQLEECLEDSSNMEPNGTIEEYVKFSGLAADITEAKRKTIQVKGYSGPIRVKDLTVSVMKHGQKLEEPATLKQCHEVTIFYADIVRAGMVNLKCSHLQLDSGYELSSLYWTVGLPIRVMEGWPLSD